MHRNVQNHKYSEIRDNYELSPLVINVNY